MDALIAVAGVVTVTAMTPGPNNFVVMRAAVHSGFAGALPAIVGIVAGGLTMLLVVALGVGVLFAAHPTLYPLITTVGGGYLCWLGVNLVRGSYSREVTSAEALPLGMAGLFGFQFLNPKSWVMVLTASAAARGGAETADSLVLLVALFTVIPTLCLALWCVLGVLMATSMERQPVRSRLDRVMGMLLIASAVLLVLPLIEALRV